MLFVNGIQGDLLGVDTTDDPRFALLLLDGVDVPIVVRMLSVRPSQLVEMLACPGFDNFGVPANFDVAGCVVWIDNQQGNFGVGQYIPAFLALAGGVDTGTLAIVVAPDQADCG
jgi:hypothetical protein